MKERIVKFLKGSWDLALYGILVLFIGMSLSTGYTHFFNRDKMFEVYNKVDIFCDGESNSVEADMVVKIQQDSILAITNNAVGHTYLFNLSNAEAGKNGYWIVYGANDKVLINPAERNIVMISESGCTYGLSNNKPARPNVGPIPKRERSQKPQEHLPTPSEKLQRAELNVPSPVRTRG